MKKNKKDIENYDEEYVQPPSYNSFEEKDEFKNTLITKLQIRITGDLNQINGVFDNRVIESQKNMKKELDAIHKMYETDIDNVNRQRLQEINQYNLQAETRINSLISSLEFTQINKTEKVENYVDWFLSFFN